jgi:hypothetical protein
VTERKYTRAEVERIVERAQAEEPGDLTESDMIAGAEEAGVPAQAVRAAATAIEREETEKHELVEWRRAQRRKLAPQVLLFVVVIGMLATVNCMTTSFPWSLLLALPWSLGIGFSYFQAPKLPAAGKVDEDFFIPVRHRVEATSLQQDFAELADDSERKRKTIQ